jgi:predicted RNA-binding protein with TRAM domain
VKYSRFLTREASDLEDSEGYSGSGGGSTGSESRGGYGGFRNNRGFGGPRPFRPSPVRVGEEYDVKIESMSRRGDSGVARVQGLVVFVPDSKPGDSVRIRITKVGRGYATGEVL